MHRRALPQDSSVPRAVLLHLGFRATNWRRADVSFGSGWLNAITFSLEVVARYDLLGRERVDATKHALKSSLDGTRCPQIPPRRPESRLSGGRWQRHQHGGEQQYRDERGELSLPPALGRTDALPSGGHREGEYQYQRAELRHDEASVRGVREIARSREVLKCQQRAASRRDQERNARDAPRPSPDGRAQLGDTRGLPRHE